MVLYMFFWVFPRRQIEFCRLFGTEYTPNRACEDGPDRGFQNVSKTQSDAGEIPKRTYTDSEHGENLKSRI
jgi:hypothetical protein